MAIPSFYHPELSDTDDAVTLAAAEAAHAVKSRRLRIGDKVRVFNGLGIVAYGELSIVERRQVSVMLTAMERLEKPSSGLTVAAAVPKGDRQKVMVDMLTQLGVSGIIPLRCEHSVTRFSDNMADKWQRAAVEAAKQSQNPWLPVIASEIEVSELLLESNRTLVFADANGVSLKHVLDACTRLTVMVGPEGGFSSSELALFKQNVIPSVKLGGHILRTEAAAIAVVAQYNVDCSQTA